MESKSTLFRRLLVPCLWMALMVAGFSLHAATDSLVWNKQKDRVDADIQSWELPKLLESVAAATGWQVYLEPSTSHKVSVKFKDLSTGEALRSMLGELNFVVVPQTNGPSRLFVFRTSQRQATQLIRAPAKAPAKPIPNQLIVTLKPGSKTKIEDLARSLGAKIIRRMDGQNSYLLQFPDAASTQAGFDSLSANPDVASIDSNYDVAAPPKIGSFAGAITSPELQLDPKPSGNNCQLVVGMIDTSLQKLDPNLQAFLLPTISVAGNSPLSSTQPTHATAMAQTILKAIQTTTNGKTSVKIQPVDVYGGAESTTTFDVANGIVQAVNNGADIINLSLGGSGDSSFLQNTISQVTQRGIPVYAAAGNEPVTTPTYPAAYPGVIAVTASDQSGNIAPYANRGSFIDMIAPGDNVISYGGQNFLVEGTSTSTAFASGMAAGLADSAGACADQAQSLLQKSLKPMPKPQP